MIADENKDHKRRYIDNEILTLTIQGAHATRGGLSPYRERGLDSTLLKLFVRARLPELSLGYLAGGVSDLDHVRNIETLANDLTDRFQSILYRERFRIGISQKLLNLYLKYQWVLGWIPEPPHCPFDANVIGKLQLANRINWTELDSSEDYLVLVTAARDLARQVGLSIASWELREWSGQSGRGSALN